MSADDPLLGRTLGGRYRVTGFIGDGAMATVYRADREVADHEEAAFGGEPVPREVALKVMHPHLFLDQTFVRRFHREAKAAATIIDPHTVRIFETGIDGKYLFMAMELLDGQDLFDVLAVHRRLSERRAVNIGVQVCQALVAAHGRGIVHRDLKPENVMISPDPKEPGTDFAKVLDFGIAKLLDREAPMSSSEGPVSAPIALTAVGQIVGTPAYMSPEQCRGEAIDARSDLYSLAVLLYQMITGRTPFVSAHPMDYAVKHIKEKPPKLRELVVGVNPDLEAIILRALNKWPDERQADAAELRDSLSALLPKLSDKPLEPVPPGGPTSKPGLDGPLVIPALAPEKPRPGAARIDETPQRLPTLGSAGSPAKPATREERALAVTLGDDDDALPMSVPAEVLRAREARRSPPPNLAADKTPIAGGSPPPLDRSSEVGPPPAIPKAPRLPSLDLEVPSSESPPIVHLAATRSPATVRRPKPAPLNQWLLIPAALLVGVAGALIYFYLIMRR